MLDTSWKRLLSAALACAMLAGHLPAISRAEAPTQTEEVEIIQKESVMETEAIVGDVPTTLAASSGTCGENLTWTLDDSGRKWEYNRLQLGWYPLVCCPLFHHQSCH